MAVALFPNVRAGLSYVGNYVMRRPYGEPRTFVTSTTGFDGAQNSHTKLTAEAIHKWNMPQLDSKRAAVRWNLHNSSMEGLLRSQPVEQSRSLTAHLVGNSAWGLKANGPGARWLANELSRNERARETLLDAYTSPEMSSFVTEKSQPGIIRNRAWTNSALVMSQDPITAGNHLYKSLKNSTLYRGRLEGMDERAKQMDSEPSRPAQAPQPEQHAPLPQPENGRGYTIDELMAFSEMFRGHGQQPVTITNSPVFNNNNGKRNIIGGRDQDGVKEASKNAGKQRGKNSSAKGGKAGNNLQASLALLSMGYALGRQPHATPYSGKIITVYPRVIENAKPAALDSGKQPAALGSRTDAAALGPGPSRVALPEAPEMQLIEDAYGKSLRAFLHSHGVKDKHIGKYRDPFSGFARNQNYPQFVKSVVAHLQSNGVDGGKLSYLKRSGSNVKTTNQQALLDVYRKAKAG